MFKRITTAMILLLAASAAFAQEGVLDPSFNNGGRRLLPVGFSSTQSTQILAMEIQPDHKILVAGQTVGAGVPAVSIQRLSVNGATSDFTTFVGTVDSMSERPTSIGIQSDGKILVAVDDSGASGNNFVLYRFDSNGVPDPAFGTAGRLLVPVTGTNTVSARVSRVLVQPDDRIVVVGTAYSDSGSLPPPAYVFQNSIMVARRLLPDGAPDVGFGTAGQAVITRFSAVQGLAPKENAYQAKLTASGKILVSGVTNPRIATTGIPRVIGDIALARLNADGSLDGTFGDGGVVVFDTGLEQSGAYDIALRSDGSFYAVSSTNTYYTVLMRFLANGSLDLSYRGLGAFVLDGIIEFAVPRPALVASIAVDASDRLLLGGWLIGSLGDFSLVGRLLPSGHPDPGFGDGAYGPGYFITRAALGGNNYEEGIRLALQGSQPILAGRVIYANVPDRYYGIVYRLTGGPELFRDGFE